ncbi:phage tail protein, partial [Pseudomonas tolaasii]
MFASKKTGYFYDPAINELMPSDAVEIDAEIHAALLKGQGEGKVITWAEDGYPFLSD